MEIVIRQGEQKDLSATLDLIKELALYEKALDQVTNTIEMMEEDGFGSHPIFGFFVAQQSDKIVGLSLFYYRYSTWKGKRLYLEDIIVTETSRGKGLGKLLLEKTIQKAKDEKCTGMTWQVLDWNEPAIKFYEKYDVKFDSEWVNCNVDFN